MRFNRYLPEETRTLLEEQYKDYIKNTPMTKKEQRAVREWVKDGHSVYENSSGGWYDGGVPIPFLEVYRDEEYIRIHTKNMSPDEARKLPLVIMAGMTILLRTQSLFPMNRAIYLINSSSVKLKRNYLLDKITDTITTAKIGGHCDHRF